MMRLVGPVVAASVLLGVSACGTSDRPPRTDVPDTLLVRAIADTYIATARAGRLDESADSLRALALDRLGLDSLDVSRALDQYAARPAALSRLYSRVTDLLREQQELVDQDGGIAPEHLRRPHVPDIDSWDPGVRDTLTPESREEESALPF